MSMTPGNKDPNRYKGRRTLSAAVLALIAAGAGAPAIYQQFLHEKEDTRLVAYQDGKRIWTICGGLTRIYGRAVRPDDRLTADECKWLDSGEQARGLVEMRKLVKPEIWATMSPAAKAGTASFCIHNIGGDKCKPSTFLRKLNAGDRNGACAEITRWIMDSGQDCRIRSNGCAGQPVRRVQEDQLCLEGSQ